jgi:hypothetical protein
MQAFTHPQRHLCSEIVSVTRLSGPGRHQILDGNLEEIGERNAVILLENALPDGTRVRVRVNGNELNGSVTSCTRDRVLGCFVAIELDLESRWSEKWFVPQHLFKLCPSLRYMTEPAPKITEKISQQRPAQFCRLQLNHTSSGPKENDREPVAPRSSYRLVASSGKRRQRLASRPVLAG